MENKSIMSSLQCSCKKKWSKVLNVDIHVFILNFYCQCIVVEWVEWHILARGVFVLQQEGHHSTCDLSMVVEDQVSFLGLL